MISLEDPFETSIEKLTSGWRGGRAEISFAKSSPEVTFTNISAALDLAPTVTYNKSCFTYAQDRATLRSDLSGT